MDGLFKLYCRAGLEIYKSSKSSIPLDRDDRLTTKFEGLTRDGFCRCNLIAIGNFSRLKLHS